VFQFILHQIVGQGQEAAQNPAAGSVLILKIYAFIHEEVRRSFAKELASSGDLCE
jgi:hypothetical protein